MATDVSTVLPDIELAPGATITVSLSDTNGSISKLNIYGISPVRDDDSPVVEIAPLFAYAPAAET